MKLLRILNVDIELHWTFLLLIALIFLDALLVGSIEPAAIVLILFTSVVLHELSHSYLAMLNGISVKRIILLPIGGMSVIDEFAMSPSVELKVSIAGPLTSFAIAAIAAGLGALTSDPTLLFLLGTTAQANLILGAFNLLPAIPLDGGRVWRALRQGKRAFLPATREAVLLSKFTIAILLLTSLLIAILTGNFALLFWNGIVALFIYLGSDMEYDAALFKAASDGVRVRDVMHGEMVCASGDETLEEAFALAKAARVRNLLIVGDRFGVVNLASFEKIPRAQWGKRRIRGLSAHPIRAHPDDGVLEIWKKMMAAGVELAPVIEGGKLIGVVSETDIERLVYLNKISLVA